MNDLVQIDDGWADAAAENAERAIKGMLLKFNEWHYTKGKEGTEVEAGTTLIALGTAAAQVKWYGGKPVEYIMRQPGKKLPERPMAEHALCLPRQSPECRSIHVRHLELGWASSGQRSCRAKPSLDGIDTGDGRERR